MKRAKKKSGYWKLVIGMIGIAILIFLIMVVGFMIKPKDRDTNVVGTEVSGRTETTEDSEVSEDSETTEVSEVSEETEETEETEEWTELSQSELEWFSTQFFNCEGKGIVNMFLTSEYSDVKDINLGFLFYGGSYGYEYSEISQEEYQVLEQECGGEIEGDVSKVTKTAMKEIVQKYLGLSLEETNQVELDSMLYLSEYDAYYTIAGDTMMSVYAFVQGWRTKDDNIILDYYNALSADPSQLYRVILKEINGEYYFVSNIYLSDEN